MIVSTDNTPALNIKRQSRPLRERKSFHSTLCVSRTIVVTFDQIFTSSKRQVKLDEHSSRLDAGRKKLQSKSFSRITAVTSCGCTSIQRNHRPAGVFFS